MPGAPESLPPESLDARRHRETRRSTGVSAAVNGVLAVAQIVVGFLASAQSLIADGLHSLSDLLSDGLVLFANSKSRHPADPEHPYGHARMETAASLVLGVLLFATGVGLLLSAGSRLQGASSLPPVQPIALWVALLTLAVKEGLFRYLLAVARRLRSPMLVANAWHSRSDAASSLVVAVGIAGSLLGYVFLDLLAAAVVGFLIALMGWRVAQDALRELIDTGLSREEVEALRKALLQTPGVVDCHELRTRRMAHQVLVDAHVQVDPRITVSEGHRIAEAARARLLRMRPEVLDVLVHVDAECDLAPEQHDVRLPDRAQLTRRLSRILGEGVPQAEEPLLHYLDNKVEAEVFLPGDWCEDARVATLKARIAAALPGDPHFRAINLNCRVAPR